MLCLSFYLEVFVLSGFNEDFDFKVPEKKDIWEYLNWYMYYEIGAEKFIDVPSVKQLKDLDLVGYDFSNMDLWGINFDNCNLSGCKFINSDLYNANFHNCIICNADFSNAVVEAAWFCGCKLSGTSFKGCSSYNFSVSDCAGFSDFGMVRERDQRAVSVLCEPLYRRGCCEDTMKEINQKGLPLPDFSYFDTISSVDYPYKKFKDFSFELFSLDCRAKSFFHRLGKKFGFCLNFVTHFNWEHYKENGFVTGVDFSGMDLSDFDLTGQSFSRCLFAGTKFPKGVLRDVSFSGCEFDDADFSACSFERVRFIGCLLFGPKVKKSQLKDFKQNFSLYYDVVLI